MKEIIFDIETDGVKATKIHCLSYCIVGEYKVETIYDYNDIINFFKQEAIFIGHFISGFDLPTIHRIVGIDFKNIHFYDTLFLSSYIYPLEKKQGLEDFGIKFGVKKVEVKKDEWVGDIHTDPVFKALMTSRCETDVKINTNLWVNINKRLDTLYEGDKEIINKLLKYFKFKADCAYEQQVNPVLIDVEGGVELLAKLSLLKQEKEEELLKVMPNNPVFKVKSKPPVMYKKDGSLSFYGEEWIQFLDKHNLQHDTDKPIKYISKYEEPNINSPIQIKNWLYSLGWEPCTHRFERNKVTNETKEIPQVLNEDKELTESVKRLLDKAPELQLLEGLGVINHRISLLSGKNTPKKESKTGILYLLDKNNYVPQTLRTVTSTLRFKHAGLVNIPSVNKPFGKELRSLFIAPEGKVVIGCDVKNLESRTRDHCIYPLDPEYVEEMSQPGYDNHLDIAVFAGLLTHEQAEAHKRGEEDYSVPRKVAKQVNFAAIYGVGSKTLSRNTGLPTSKCDGLLNGYWRRNWSVKTYSESLKVKRCLNNKWIKSEISGFWLQLRSDNDKFSAHNQNLGVFYFDTWLSYVRHFGIIINFQTHDEVFFYWDEGKEQEAFDILHKSARLANRRLNLNVEIAVDAQSGSSYGAVH